MIERMNLSEAKSSHIILIKKWLGLVLNFSIVCEMLIFPSWENLAGCLMVLVVWKIFSIFFLTKKIFLEHTFSFLTYLTLFLACYLPLPATLLEGKPITYGFEVPMQTFFWEAILFFVASLAFYMAIIFRNKQNNFIQNIFIKYHFFKADRKLIWLLGILGFLVRIRQMSFNGEIEFGDVNNKFLAGLTYLQYAPIVLLFPSLARVEKGNKVFVWLYIGVIFIISLATNSREAIINPILMVAILFVLNLLVSNQKLRISASKLILIIISVLYGINLLSDISLAMLANRGVRSEVSKLKLFEKTLETLQDEYIMNRLRNTSLEDRNKGMAYNLGWNETYLNNFMLNRYGNMRITDQTLYYANKIGFGNEKMQESFNQKAVGILPLPILNYLGININKNELIYSPGDMLYNIGGGGNALGSYRVTSLISDGLATFGYWCLLIIFSLFFLLFKLLDSFVIHKDGKVLYSTLALISVFSFVGMLRHSNGMLTLVSYIFRGFWQQCFTFGLLIMLLNIINISLTKKI